MGRERVTQFRTGLRAWSSQIRCGRLKSCHDKRQERFLASLAFWDGYVLGMIECPEFGREAREILGNGELLDMASLTRYVRVHRVAFV